MRPSQTLNDPEQLHSARRRRAKRRITQLAADEGEAFLERLARETTPDVALYLRVLLAALLIGLGFRFDQRALLVGGVLIAPRLAPLAGLSLGAVTGSGRFFLRQLGGLLVALGLSFLLAGASGGLALPAGSRLLLALQHTQFNLVDFGLLLVGAVLLSVGLARDSALAPLPSVAVAYELLLPLGAAGIGVLHGDGQMWQGALLTFSLHLVWAIGAGLVALLAMGFRPLMGNDRMLAGAIVMIGIVGLFGAFSMGATMMANVPTPTPTPTATPTPTPTPTPTATPTITPTATSTPTPTPIPPQGRVSGTKGQGAILRQEPTISSAPVGFLAEGTQVDLLDSIVGADGYLWWKVRLSIAGEMREGWLRGDLIVRLTSTPPPP